MKKKITVLLGAGFAIYAKGLSTKDINAIFSQFKCFMVGEYTLYCYIENKLKAIYTDFNFETFLAVIENVLDYRLGEFREGPTSTSWKDISSETFNLKEYLSSVVHFENVSSTFNVYRSYINLLINGVQNYDDTYKCKEQLDDFKEYLNVLHTEYKQVKIYSTNYDLLLPTIFENDQIMMGVDNSNSFDRDFISLVSR